MTPSPGASPVVLPNVASPDFDSLFDHRVADVLSTGRSSGLSRAGDAHVVALRTMFDAIRHTMDEYAVLLAERGKQIVADAPLARADTGEAHAAHAAAALRVTRNREARVGTLVGTLTAFVDRVWSGHIRLERRDAPNAAGVCAEMARVADKWLRFVEATALRDARRRTALEEGATPSATLEW